jgi:2-polyprenyl-3-methyl-5-hydroxy-6-metoxy-1,4-benzoquinol methylase
VSCPVCKAENYNKIGQKNNYTIVSCPSCSCVYVHPVPDLDELESIYDDYLATDKYIKKLGKKVFTSKYKISRLKKYLNDNQKKFLDVGCNIGATVKAAQVRGFVSTGIDLDQTSIAKAQELFVNCEFKVCSTFDLVESGRKFDFIFCSEVIEHVPFSQQFVLSLADLLEPGGLLYLSTPDIGHSRVPHNLLNWKEIKPPEHIVFFNKKSMRILLEKHGFEIIKFYWNHRANLRVVCRKKQCP